MCGSIIEPSETGENVNEGVRHFDESNAFSIVTVSVIYDGLIFFLQWYFRT